MTGSHTSHIDEHVKTVDDLHAKIAADPNIDKEKLQAAVTKLKKAYAQFDDDVQGCVSR